VSTISIFIVCSGCASGRNGRGFFPSALSRAIHVARSQLARLTRMQPQSRTLGFVRPSHRICAFRLIRFTAAESAVRPSTTLLHAPARNSLFSFLKRIVDVVSKPRRVRLFRLKSALTKPIRLRPGQACWRLRSNLSSDFYRLHFYCYVAG